MLPVKLHAHFLNAYDRVYEWMYERGYERMYERV